MAAALAAVEDTAAVDTAVEDTAAAEASTEDRITIIIGMAGGDLTFMAMAAVASACSCRLYFCP
jgi:hypothetical protein